MKAYFVALLIASSILLSLVDTGNYEVQDSTKIIVPDFAEEPQICGPKTFSNSVRSAFIRESDLEKYSSPQLYLTKEWVVVLKDPYCLNNLGMIVDNSRIESYHDFDILSGTWIIEFQTGDLALQYLNELHVSGYIWKFYPMVEQHLALRYEPDDPYYESGDQWYLDNYGQNGGTSGIDLNTQGAWNEFTGKGIVIGVVDDGIDYDNPDLSPNFLSQYSYDYCGNDTNVMPVDSYDDGFNINCVGDTFQNLGTPTILFEAGHLEAYDRNDTRKAIYAALLQLINCAVTKSYEAETVEDYMSIPQNDKKFYDIILRNVAIKEEIKDIAIQYREELDGGLITFSPYIAKIDDLNDYYAHKELECSDLDIQINTSEKLAEEIDIVNVLINGKKLSFVKNT